MCNHYRNHPEAIDTWREYIGWSQPGEPDQFSDIKIDVWPKYPAMVGRKDETGATVIDVMKWGVPLKMPGKRPGTTITKNVTNVRNLTSPFWRSMISKPAQRCVVPFTEFAEPKPGKDPDTGRPAEWWFSLADDRRGGFAGIWRYAEDAGGKVFAFLTCEPNPLVEPLHAKAMPVILAEEDYERWLTAEHVTACELAVPYASQLMKVR